MLICKISTASALSVIDVFLQGLTPSPCTESSGHPATPVVSIPKSVPSSWLSERFPQLLFKFSWTVWLYEVTLNPQVTLFWEKVLDKDAKERLVSNIAGHLKDAKEFLQKRAVSINLWKKKPPIFFSFFFNSHQFSFLTLLVNSVEHWRCEDWKGRRVNV